MEKPKVALLRGMFGFSRLLWWEYFHGAPKLLEQMGFEVIVPPLPWGQSSAARAAVLAEALAGHDGRLHIIAHSMGGVDARRYISHLGGRDKVASLTTISSPHHGSALAEQVMDMPWLPWWRIPAVADLTRAAMERFNAATPDVPGIAYRSYSAARPPEEQPWLVRRLGRRIEAAEGDNDSMVSVRSAIWGEHIATLRADHYELIGSRIWLNPLRRRTGFDHLALYRDIGIRIRNFESEHGGGGA